MGLYVQSLKNIPANVDRDYFVYLLDYGWDEPLGEALKRNFDKMAKLAAENRAVVIIGTDRVHFEDEVFSYHSINGEDANELLPAILITNRHPSKFKESFRQNKTLMIEENLKIILIPLKKFCNNSSDVVTLIDKLFRDIQDQKDLSDFTIEREMRKGFGQALADAIVLKPNFMVLGYDFNSLVNFFKKK